MKLFDIIPYTQQYIGVREYVAVIDGTNVFCRACLAQYKDSSDDLSITVSNFCKMVNKILANRPKYVVFVFDSGKQNFRHKLFPAYKSNRKTVIKDKDIKLKLIKSILINYGFSVLTSGEFEADDIIGSLSRLLRKEAPVHIYSEDKDFLQCVRSNVLLHKGGLIYDKKLCTLKFGVTPRQFIDYLSLVGDTADCIPGAAKWGKKTAAKALTEFGTIERIQREAKLTKSQTSIYTLNVKLMRKLTRIKTTIGNLGTLADYSVKTKNCGRLQDLAKYYKIHIGDFYH